MKQAARTTALITAAILVMIVGGFAVPATAQTICQACGRCDQDGDGLFKNSNRCRKTCPAEIRDNDDSVNFDGNAVCEGPDPGVSPQIAAEFIAGDFGFASLNETEIFTLNDRGNRAHNDDAATLVPIDGDTWALAFAEGCPGLLASAPDVLDAGPGKVELAKSAGDVRIIFPDITVDPAFLRAGIESAEITFQLIGKDQGNLHFPTRLDDPPVDWAFTRYRIWGRSTSKGKRRTCDGPDEIVLPDQSEHTLQLSFWP